MENTERFGLRKAITKAGSQAMLAAALGCRQQAVSKWLQQGHVPLERAVQIQRLYGVEWRRLVKQKFAELVAA